MDIHQQHENKASDLCFETGSLYHIVPGNRGRVLDGRRTPGFIKEYDKETAMFMWEITDFEDRGKCWVIPAEEISAYQFEKGSRKLTAGEVIAIGDRCKAFSEKLVIVGQQSEYEKTSALIEKEKETAKRWFLTHSQFAAAGSCKLNLELKVGSELLFSDLKSYLGIRGLWDLEKETSEHYLLNPSSGEWIKGLKIVMAEMGLIDFDEKIPRTKDIFLGIGSKKKRMKYIISRLAFVQSFFALVGHKEVQLFRGMSTEGTLYTKTRTLISTSFNPEVAKAFSDIDKTKAITFSYLVKFTYPVENLFMTFFETKAFNERYQEQEAIVLYREKLFF